MTHTAPHYALNGIVILSAFVLDLILGDPRWLPHPVRGIGWMVRKIEAILRHFTKTPSAERTAGVILVILVISPVFFTAQFLVHLTFHGSHYPGFVLSVLLAYTTLAARELGNAAKAVLKHLDAGDVAQARAELSMIVGRDTAQLDEREIVRAVVETVAENTSDGVVAPIFYLALGGPALALAYKAVNTLDSMVGYKNERYLHFGRAAAKLDDAANFVPARITGVLICLAAELSCRLKQVLSPSPASGEGNSELRTLNSELNSPWRIMFRDNRNHPSPNSGYPEAAMAGSLGIRLGGPSAYGGRPNLKPFIGDAVNFLDKKYIEKAVRLMYCATLLAVLGATVSSW